MGTCQPMPAHSAMARLTAEQKARIAELRQEGKSFEAIAKAVG